MAVTAPIVAATIAVAGAVLAAWARAGGTGGPLAAVSLPASIVLIAVAGCVLALARPDNRVGSIMVAAATAWGVGEGMFDLAVRGIVAAPGTVPGADWLAIGGSAVRAVGWGAAAVAVPVFFPDGHLPGPRWRWLGWTLAGSLVATFFGVALDPHAQNFELQAAGWHSPLHLPGAAASLANLLGTLSLPLTGGDGGGLGDRHGVPLATREHGAAPATADVRHRGCPAGHRDPDRVRVGLAHLAVRRERAAAANRDSGGDTHRRRV